MIHSLPLISTLQLLVLRYQILFSKHQSKDLHASSNVLIILNLLSANTTKWSQQTQRICWQQPTNCLSVFDNFVGLALKGLTLFEAMNGKLLST